MNSRFWKVVIAASLIGWANASHPAPAQDVAVEVRIVKVPDAVVEQLNLSGCKTEQPAGSAASGPSCPACKSSPPCSASQANAIFMNDAEVRQFLQTAQADGRTSVLAAP